MLNFNLFLPLYSWGIGTALIILFAFVCLGLVLIVMHLMRTDTPKEESLQEFEEENNTEKNAK